jgi:excisionase family DNA binding protein
MMAEDELLTVAEVAARVKSHPETVRRWLKDGKIQGVMPGGKRLGWRIRESELDRFLRDGTEA